MNKYTLLYFMLPTVLVGCTTNLNAIRAVKSSTLPAAGAPYNLSFTQFNVVVTRRVDKCERPATQAEIKAGDPRVKSDVVVKVAAEVTASEQRDPKRTYVIDLESLQGFFKSTDVKVAYYETGVIKSINATAEDKTGEFITSIAQTIAKVATAAAGVKSGPPGQEACTANVAKIVRELEKNQGELESLTTQLEYSTEQVKQFSALAASLGKNLTAVDKNELGRRINTLIGFQDAQQALKAQIEANLKLISVVDEVKWPKDGETFVSDKALVDAIDADTQLKWFGKAGASFIPDTAVFFELTALEPIGRTTPCAESCPDDTVKGIKYRMPALGVMTLCSSIKLDSITKQIGCEQGKRVSKPTMISQLGRVFVLPLKSTVFSTKTIVASFSETGVPTELGATSAAASDKAAASLSGLADAAISIKNSRSQKAAADLEAKIKVLKLQKELSDATAALAPPSDRSKQDATDAFSVDTALINAELANIQARKALEELKKVN